MMIMLLLRVFAFLLGLTLASPLHITQANRNALQARFAKDFVLSDIAALSCPVSPQQAGNTTTPALNPTTSLWNDTLTFQLTDLNTNTSTTCTKSYLETRPADNSTEASPSFDLCADTHVQYETYRWRFEENPTEFGKFLIELDHSFNDPAQFPPPFSVVTYFSEHLQLNLTCSHLRDGGQSCKLPHREKTLNAPVNGMSD
ncbi:hypothetical protein G7Y89_g167 [Cudoniella acicularis]|uniref:AA1-like domain-containing protein n=1 Tax=Cudoniella acicularis TaxID=354080 RepID=A0A8H4S0C8_9HELO|nr:hypothetical protein G7Y89_g167 [Cudoniella acicularis]